MSRPDKLRTACLNVKYYSRRLRSVERWNLTLEFLLGGAVLRGGGRKAALNLTRRIKEYESVLSGYRMLEYDLAEIRTMVEQKRKYDQPLQAEFKKAKQREKALIAKNRKPPNALASTVDAKRNRTPRGIKQ